MYALMTGRAYSRFGESTEQAPKSLIVGVAGEAVWDAGFRLVLDIDAIYVGQFNSGMFPLALVSSLAGH